MLPELELRGDATVTLLAPVEFSGAFEHPDLRTALDDHRRRAIPTDDGSDWQLLPPQVDDLVAGSLTYHRRLPTGFTGIAVPTDLNGLSDRLLPGLFDPAEPSEGPDAPTPIRLLNLDVFVFDDGTLSMRCDLSVVEGWEDEGRSLEEWFGPMTRDRSCDQLRVGMEQALGPVVSGLTGARWHEARIPYFHVIYRGCAHSDEPGRALLGDGLRSLVYPPDNHPVPSASPLPEAFVYPGYAFSLVGVGPNSDSGEAHAERFIQLARFAQQLYRRIARTCDDVEASLEHVVTSLGDLDELRRWEFQLQGAIHAFVTPTFTFDHAVLVLRDRLQETWRLPTLLARVDYLIERLRLVQEGRRDHRDKRRQWLLQVLIALVTALSLVQVIDSGVSIYERFATSPPAEQAPDHDPSGELVTSDAGDADDADDADAQGTHGE